MTTFTGNSIQDDPASEIILASRVSQGDEDATRQLLEIALPRVEKTAFYLCSDHSEREEVIQNTLIEIMKSACSFQGNSRFSYWVDRITLHMASRIIHKNVRRRRIQEQTFLPVAAPRSVEDEMDYRKMQRELSLMLQKIGQKERTALVLHCLYGYSAEEVANMTSTGIFTVRGRLRNGKRKLKKLVLRNETLADWMSVEP